MLNLLNGGVAFIAMKLSGINEKIDLKNKKQYLIDIYDARIMSLILAVIPILFGVSLIGNSVDFFGSNVLFNCFFIWE